MQNMSLKINLIIISYLHKSTIAWYLCTAAPTLLATYAFVLVPSHTLSPLYKLASISIHYKDQKLARLHRSKTSREIFMKHTQARTVLRMMNNNN